MPRPILDRVLSGTHRYRFGISAVLLHWAGDIGPRLAIKSPTELGILLILPLIYYIFDYATNVYTTLFHLGLGGDG